VARVGPGAQTVVNGPAAGLYLLIVDDGARDRPAAVRELFDPPDGIPVEF
jgi:hypothetical protein